MADNDETSLRDSLSAAYDAAETAPATEVAPAEVAPAVETETPAAEPTPTEGAEASADRDEKGRFKSDDAKPPDAAKPDAKAEQAPKDAKEAKAPPAATASTSKPPQSWSPTAREHWTKLPPEVQAEVAKRERETAQALQETAGARRLAEQVQQVVSPYMQFLRSEPNAQGGVGVDPMQAFNSLLGHAQTLRQGPVEAKGRAIAQWIQEFGVPLEAINKALGLDQPAGQPGQQPAPQPAPQPIDPRAIVQQVRQEFAQERQQHIIRQAEQDTGQFMATHEFLDQPDLKADMAALLESAASRGVALSMEEAYSRACRAHPEVNKIMTQREAAKSAEAARAVSHRTRAAASSVHSQAGGTRPGALSETDDLRAHLSAAYDELSGSH